MEERRITILLADDDLEDLELLEEAILNIEPEFKVAKVTTGKDVVNFLSKCSKVDFPSLIILDYNMPEMNAEEVLIQLGKDARFRSIPKLVLSTSNASAYVQKSLEKGASSYFVKPTNLKELEEITARMLSFLSYN